MKPKSNLALIPLLLQLHQTNSECVNPDNVCEGSGPSKRPLPGCTTFAECDAILNTVTTYQTCTAGTLFDTLMGICNWDYLTFCNVKTCAPTPSPTVAPTTQNPTLNPTGRPSTSPTTSPTDFPTTLPSVAPSESRDGIFLDTVLSKQALIENLVLVSYTSSGLSYPSRQYTFTDFFDALQLVVQQGFGDTDFQFLSYEGNPSKYHYGLVNLAAFLAQAMVESIQYDACDELNWQEVAGRYAISNSCGQEGRSYQDETCSTEESYMSCPVDFEMEMTAISSAGGVRAPPPLTCKPGTGPGHYSGYWDTSSGVEIVDTPYSNGNGRTDTEGCCWWGRGALNTKGTCNLGKINWYLGKQAVLDGRSALYPNIDFCSYPEAICSSDITSELRWTVAFFEWTERIQRYRSYVNNLIQFVDNGVTDDYFIDMVSRIVAFGCHTENCGGRDVRNAQQRKDNFYMIINDVFDIPSIVELKDRPTPEVTPSPSFRLDFDGNVSETTTAIPQLKPVLAPSLEVLQNPQPGPYNVPPIGYQPDVTDMPTYEDADGLISLEGNGSDGRFRPIMSLFAFAGGLLVALW